MRKLIVISIITFTGFISCTDLEPEVYTDITYDTFFKTEEQVLSAAGPAYASLNALQSPACAWSITELTTDEMVLPTRGIHWYNDGIFQRLHKHEWIPTEDLFNSTWKVLYAGITNCNLTLALYADIEEQSEALITVSNELKALRSLYYFELLDLFGNVPIITSFDVPEDFAPENSTRKEVFDFVNSELITSTATLNNTVDMSTYGRFGKYAALTLLAKLYMNAEVYIGEAMWDEAIDVCDSIINSGKYSINTDYFANFAIDNETSAEELIFVVPFTDLLPPHWGDAIYPPRMFNHHLWTLHFNGGQVFNCEQGSWGGFCAVPSHYNSFNEQDRRRSGWLTGLQISWTGDTLFCNQERSGEPLIYTTELTSLEGAYENEGARWAKYDYTEAKNNQLANDWVFFRYADVLLMKAEALMRKNDGAATQEAVDLANEVRERAFIGDASKLYTTGTLTLDELLAERGREFYGEMWRRNDLIRFGKFNDPIGNTRPTAASDIYNLFPIPEIQLNSNPNLVQNPGY